MNNNKQGYSIITSKRGYILYRLNGKRIAKNNVPSHIVRILMIDYKKPIIDCDSSKNKTQCEEYHEYTYMPTGNSKFDLNDNPKEGFFYYCDGIWVERFDLPHWVSHKDMKDERSASTFRERWNKLWRAYKEGKEKVDKTYRKTFSHNKSKYREYKEKCSSGLPDNMNPESLLCENGINNKKDYYKWILKNHPDKNPDADINLVALINTAVEMVYG